ncbi:hypothetical protein [Coralloluteibacterium thermophilus]|uniref:DUF2188 domain-containing protein n=1 Tax=Coralloluteibacterium thermophilum TaxID=2707049 RepID=A0ABV9NL23_9GAMM
MTLVFEARQDAWSHRWVVTRDGSVMERGLPNREAALGAAVLLAQAEHRRNGTEVQVRVQYGKGDVRLERSYGVPQSWVDAR